MLAARALPDRVWWGASVLVWAPRAAAVFVVSAWLVLGKAAEAEQWAHLRWHLVAAMMLVWVMLDGLARGGASTEVSAHLAAIFFAGAVVLLYSHNAMFTELAVLIGSAMFGIAIAAAGRSSDDRPNIAASGAIPAAVLFLPELLLGTRPSHADNKVPAECFWLVALAPLVLAPFFLPWVGRQNRWLLLALRVLAVLAPLVVAVALAGKYEKFAFEEEPQW
jgi:hypothetical protein